MKRFFKLLPVLLSLAFLASPALADDTITSWNWSSVTGTFQAKLAALGWKNVPDEQHGTFTATLGAVSGTVSATWLYSRVGKLVVITTTGNLTFTKDGTNSVVTVTGLPASILPTSTVGASPFGFNYNSGTAPFGNVDVTTSGLSLYRSSAQDAFSSGTVNILVRGSITYTLN